MANSTVTIPSDLANILRALAAHAETEMKTSTNPAARIEENWSMLADYLIRGYGSVKPNGIVNMGTPCGRRASFRHDGSGKLTIA